MFVAPGKTDAAKAKSPLRTVVKIGLPLALAALTGFGVVGYAVGRAYLEGWYAAAGVSALTFTWDLQYVILRGLASDLVNLWMLFIAIVAAMIVCLGGIELVSVWISEWRPRAKSQSSSTAPSNEASPKPHVKKFLQSVLIAIMLLCLAGVWYSASRLLNKVPKEQGQRDFYGLLVAATCPSQATVVSGITCAKSGLPLAGTYAWVDVQSPVLKTTAQGWLLQQQGSTVLLLTPGGIDLLTLGDSPFDVSNRSLAVTSDSSGGSPGPIATPPRFKPDPDLDAENAMAASVSASTAMRQSQPTAKSAVRTPASSHTTASAPAARPSQH